MPVILDFPPNIVHKRHVRDLVDAAGTKDLPVIDWVACTITFDDPVDYEYVDMVQGRIDSYDPAQTELDMLAGYIGDSPIEGMTPLEAFQFVSDAVNNATTVAQVKNVLQQTLPVLIAFMAFKMHNVRDDDRL